MTPEVNKRIEQIQRGEVPKGYKKTKHGIVPEDWAEQRIGDFIHEHTEKTTVPNQFPVLTSSRKGLMLQSEYYSNRQVTSDDNVGYNILPYGYITFRSRSDDGKFCFNENRIIEKGIISYFYPVFSFDERVNKDYMLSLLNHSIQRRFFPYCEGTAQQVLSLKKLGNLVYSLPEKKEQGRIVQILSEQDKVIELLDRKVEQLQRLKKYCLAKMFPQKGTNAPEIRFPEFSDPWEQRKLGEMVQFSKGSGYSKGDLKESGTPIILYGRLYTKYETVISDVDTFADVKAGSVYSRGGEVIVPASGETAEDISIASVVEKPGVLLGGDLNIITPPTDLDSAFLAISISNGKPHNDMAKMAQGKSVVHLHNTDLEKIVLTFPSHEEQVKISAYFKRIDSLITLHQRKRDEEVKKKKALIQLLLTGIVRV